MNWHSILVALKIFALTTTMHFNCSVKLKTHYNIKTLISALFSLVAWMLAAVTEQEAFGDWQKLKLSSRQHVAWCKLWVLFSCLKIQICAHRLDTRLVLWARKCQLGVHIKAKREVEASQSKMHPCTLAWKFDHTGKVFVNRSDLRLPAGPGSLVCLDWNVCACENLTQALLSDV